VFPWLRFTLVAVKVAAMNLGCAAVPGAADQPSANGDDDGRLQQRFTLNWLVSTAMSAICFASRRAPVRVRFAPQIVA
jgi:hypothetical protein